MDNMPRGSVISTGRQHPRTATRKAPLLARDSAPTKSHVLAYDLGQQPAGAVEIKAGETMDTQSVSINRPRTSSAWLCQNSSLPFSSSAAILANVARAL